MKRIEDLINKFKTLPAKTFLKESLQEGKEIIEDYNAEQLLKGTTSTGEEITPKYRNPLYEDLKQRMNPKPSPGTPDLKLTGAFHKGIIAHIEDDQIRIESTEAKTSMLTDKYGDEIIGLSEESKSKIRTDILKPYMLIKFREYLKIEK